ncbi:hypothetical protein FVEG_17563 [Fusarium verticillioides 7600]|uniref:Alcohol dehydrogenase iron-type/glycerol dehydrogenase GldA domain-containing protein n=1 Tax=Gibberella moniliformis (strain M3125 / FGSC 7600) TaxID=334819 RepID=W7N7C8_GIBM7|nr:hypothetical protein FVEG_17563 [Fusarium verticillioides 7600]EWG55634.1 hypothetical protein FVEG_17563 [Fusarium verticillioides 7600]
MSETGSGNTPYVEDLKSALSKRGVDVHIGILPHTLIPEIIDILAEVKRLEIDCMVKLGAGSIMDGGKLIQFAIANGWTEDEIGMLWGGKSHNPNKWKDIKKPRVPLMCIMTLLSGGEYQAIAGATGSKNKAKHIFEPDHKRSDSTLISALLTTALRRCARASLQSGDDGGAWAARGLEKLVSELLRRKYDPRDLGDILDLIIGIQKRRGL